MATFTYKARNVTGAQVAGTLVADSQIAAARMLDERRLLPVELNEVDTAKKSFITGQARRISSSKIGVVYEQMADLLTAGVPLLRALDVLSRQSDSKAVARVLREVHEGIAGGETLAEAMGNCPEAFPALHCAMIRAGEKGGFLEEVLTRLSEFVARQDELRNRFIGAMAYPCILILALTGAASVLLLYVVPKIRPMLEGTSLPWATRLVFGLTDLLKDHYVPVLGVGVVVLLALLGFLQSAPGRQFRARLQLRAWMIGRIYTMVALCRFCRILGTLLANGIPIIQSLEVAKDSAGNPILAAAIHEAAESVRQGEALTKPLAASKLFPPSILDMIAVAEESNTLDKTLVQIANTQEARTGRQIDLFVRLLEPLLLLLTAGMVLFVAVALLLPILTMATSGVK